MIGRADAAARGTVNEDIPTNHSPFFAPILHPTIERGVESTLDRRRRWKGEAATIPEGLLRLSVGVEHVEVVREDRRFVRVERRAQLGGDRQEAERRLDDGADDGAPLDAG